MKITMLNFCLRSETKSRGIVVVSVNSLSCTVKTKVVSRDLVKGSGN